MDAPPPRQNGALLRVLCAATLWAINGVVARSLFKRQIDPTHLVQIRMMLGGAAFLPFLFIGPRPSLRLSAALVPYAFILGAVQLTYFKAIQSAGVAIALFLQYTAPLLVASWEALRARRLPSRPVMASLAAAVAGSALLVLPSGSLDVPVAGIAWGIGSSFAFGAATLYADGMRRRGVGAIPLVAGGLLIGSLLFAPIRAPWTAVTQVAIGDWPYFLFVGVLATAVPFGLYASALGRIRGSVAILLAMLEPVLAGALAWSFLGESLSLPQVAGAALILAGVAVAARASTGNAEAREPRGSEPARFEADGSTT